MVQKGVEEKTGSRRDPLIALCLFLLLALVYWHWRSFSFGDGESAEHVIGALRWGVSWPPGFPLYNLLAHFFSLVVPGPPEAAVNGFSGLCDAAAAALFFLVLRAEGLELAPSLMSVGFIPCSGITRRRPMSAR
jgi:hypothetical protein